jgi:hypothetical protein
MDIIEAVPDRAVKVAEQGIRAGWFNPRCKAVIAGIIRSALDAEVAAFRVQGQPVVRRVKPIFYFVFGFSLGLVVAWIQIAAYLIHVAR